MLLLLLLLSRRDLELLLDGGDDIRGARLLLVRCCEVDGRGVTRIDLDERIGELFGEKIDGAELLPI